MEKQNDKIWGIERHPESADFGQLVCPTVFVWSTHRRVKMVFGIAHNTPVTVIDRKWSKREGRWMYRIELPDSSKGWLPPTLLKDIGAGEYPPIPPGVKKEIAQ